MFYKIKAVFILCLAFMLPVCAQANEPAKLEELVNKVSNVYGVKKLQKARTVRLEQELLTLYPNHNYTPDFAQYGKAREHYVFDLVNERASGEYLNSISGNFYHARNMPLGDGYAFIDYGNMMYQPSPEAGFLSEFGGTIRSSDTLLAYSLVKYKDSAKYLGQKNWLGTQHHVVHFDFPNSPPLSLYIQPDTGFIAVMKRTLPNGLVLAYTFSDHETKRGVSYAREHIFYPGRDRPNRITNRRIVLNDRVDRDVFTVDAGVNAEPERLDQSKMTAEKHGHEIYHVGTGEAYSTFIHKGNYVIALGASAGLKDRLEAYRKASGVTAPLRYIVLSDHHAEDIAGIVDVADRDITLIATPETKPAIKHLFEQNGQTLDAVKIEFVSKEHKIDDVQVLRLSTAHAQSVLVAYSPADKTLFQSGHYISPYAAEPFYIKFTAYTLFNEVEHKGLDIDWLLSSASRKPEKWSEFAEKARVYKRIPCHNRRAICKNWP